jgi:3'(2'), 5'-bisphosphate nucleotidase
LESNIDLEFLLEIALKAAIKAGIKTLEYFQRDNEITTKEDDSPLTLADLESNRIINEFLEPTGIPILSEENQMVSFNIRKSWKKFWLVDPLDGTKEFIKKRPEYTVNIALIDGNHPVLGVVYIPATGILYYGIKNTGSYKTEIRAFSSITAIRNESHFLPFKDGLRPKPLILVSRSHLSDDTKAVIDKIESAIGECSIEPFGSSLKFCLIAEGRADIYPRIGSTMEWDTAASHAIVEAAGCVIFQFPEKLPLIYNKENLLNPSFIVFSKEMNKTMQTII